MPGPASFPGVTRRQFVAAAASLALGPSPRLNLLHPSQSALPRPSPVQLLWQQDELALFLHFGVNTFTDREWGVGTEDPAIFAPSHLEPRQWAVAARAAGARALVLTAKHHDGFCLWPTATSRHSVVSSPWRAGRGDVVLEFVEGCRSQGLRAGLYCSPWDRNAPSYGDSPRYNDLFCDQLTELLTRYGAIHEVWFDGANGEGPNGKRQVYDWPRFFGLVKRLQPDSVIFSDAGPDVRWIGNERGVAGEPNWSMMDPAAVPYPGASGDHVTRALQHGDRAGTVWRPGESDVSIRPGWFYHPAEDEKVKTEEQLVDLFFSSVGRNSKLLLNVPPTRTGELHPVDGARLRGLHRRLTRLREEDLVAPVRHQAVWRSTGPRSAATELDLGRLVTAGVSELKESIERGQRVARYRLEGSDGGPWQTLARGSTIGYCRLNRFPAQPLRRIRLEIEDAITTVEPVEIRLFAGTESDRSG